MIIANYLPMGLRSNIQNRIFSLLDNTVDSWDELKHLFIANFSMTSEQEKT